MSANKINPMLIIDFYKAVHAEMLPKGITKSVSYFTPRMSRVNRWDKVVMFGLQGFIKNYLIDYFNEEFFGRPFDEVIEDYKRIMDTLCIPKDEYVAFKRLCDESFDAWILAKSKADYSIFEPYLKRVIESKKKLYGYRNSDKSIYNQMLDDFEPGMSVEKYDIFFEALKNRLVPLIKKVTNAKQIKEDFLYQSFPVEEQKKFMELMQIYCRLHLQTDLLKGKG